jgi:hypothetical protein
MKKLKIIYIAILIGIPLAGCEILDQDPEDLILTDNAITDRLSAESALNGLYDALQDGDLYGGRFMMATEMTVGNGRAAAFQQFWAELESGIVPASNFHIEDNWVDSYLVINSANSILKFVPDVDELSDEEKDNMLGTAYFMRALMHFDLLRQYGEHFNAGSAFGVQLVTDIDNGLKEVPRSSVAATYQQIEDDLSMAVQLLPNQGDKFYVSSGAAEALLARVYLYSGNYSGAVTAATNVINNPLYSLTDDYNEIYEVEGSSESIFELEFNPQDPNVWAVEMYVSPPEVAVNSNLANFFDGRGDIERGLLFEDIGGIVRCTKYGSLPEQEDQNSIVLRISEMYLIRAEALARTGVPVDGLTDLNTIRQRAELTDILPGQVTTLDEFLEILLDERRAEFAFEGQYWFDLARTGRITDRVGLDPFRSIFPVPQRELNITDGVLVQNPGF